MSFRLKRVNELIKQEVGKIIQKEIHIGDYLVTIIDVESSADLNHAVIKISILPENKEKQALEFLKKNAGYIQKILNKKLTMKFVPRISFAIDKGVKSADRVDIILEKIKIK